VLWTLAARAGDMVIEANFHPDSDEALGKLRGLGGRTVEVHCACPAEVAHARYNARSRHEVHQGTLPLSAMDKYDRPAGRHRPADHRGHDQAGRRRGRRRRGPPPAHQLPRRGTSGAHEREIRRGTLRAAEISAAGQTACSAHPSKSTTPLHKTRPTGRLTLFICMDAERGSAQPNPSAANEPRASSVAVG
jgi:hypothetical protein